MGRVGGLSMRALARRMGVATETLSDWESGANVPTRASVYALLDELMAAQREADAIRSRARRLRRRSTELLGQNPHKSSSSPDPTPSILDGSIAGVAGEGAWRNDGRAT
jgi:transcriptional regulator with XRE-family HTH domain